MPLLPEGAPAPDFAARDQRGGTVRLAEHRGKAVVLYFYPMDDTPGCTAEACGFRDDIPAWQRAGAVVMGVSTQGVDSHRGFAAKHALPFPLLADTDKAICRAYGALGLTGLARRVTYLIGPDGRVARAWDKVSPRGHSQEVLAALAGLPPT
jgi:peroxiredoxin Q/BCP